MKNYGITLTRGNYETLGRQSVIQRSSFNVTMMQSCSHEPLTSVWVLTQKEMFLCLILPQFSCFSSFFQFFAQKNIGKADLNQHWECTAPKRLSKYATSVVRRTILSHSFSNQYKPLLLLKGKKNSKFACPR